MSPHATQLLPARYNIQSELISEVTANGPNTFGFDLRDKLSSPDSAAIESPLDKYTRHANA